MTKRWVHLLVGALVVGGVGLAVVTAVVGQDLVHTRESTCDGAVPMPVGAFWSGWAAVVLAGLGLGIVVVRAVRRRRVPAAAVACAAFALLITCWVLVSTYQDAVVGHSPCFG